MTPDLPVVVEATLDDVKTPPCREGVVVPRSGWFCPFGVGGDPAPVLFRADGSSVSVPLDPVGRLRVQPQRVRGGMLIVDEVSDTAQWRGYLLTPQGRLRDVFGFSGFSGAEFQQVDPTGRCLTTLRSREAGPWQCELRDVATGELRMSVPCGPWSIVRPVACEPASMIVAGVETDSPTSLFPPRPDDLLVKAGEPPKPLSMPPHFHSMVRVVGMCAAGGDATTLWVRCGTQVREVGWPFVPEPATGLAISSPAGTSVLVAVTSRVSPDLWIADVDVSSSAPGTWWHTRISESSSVFTPSADSGRICVAVERSMEEYGDALERTQLCLRTNQ